jgi:uncharacterized membrane protein YesL
MPADDPSLRPDEHTYVRFTAAQMWSHLPLLLLGAAAFSLLCAPAAVLLYWNLIAAAILAAALIVAPAWAALLALEAEIVREGQTKIGVLFRALPRYWARAALLGAGLCVPLSVGALTLPLLAGPQAPLIVAPAWVALLGLAADGFVLFFLTMLSLYAFPLLVLYDADLRTVLRNAFILSARYLSNTLGLLGMGVLFYFAVVYLASGLLFFLPAVWGVFLVNNCRMVVDQERRGK